MALLLEKAGGTVRMVSARATNDFHSHTVGENPGGGNADKNAYNSTPCHVEAPCCVGELPNGTVEIGLRDGHSCSFTSSSTYVACQNVSAVTTASRTFAPMTKPNVTGVITAVRTGPGKCIRKKAAAGKVTAQMAARPY